VRVDGAPWSEVYCGDVEFRTASGWRFVVFNDCEEWDYFDAIESPDGRALDFDDIWPPGGDPKMRGLLNYTPNERAWGLA
jgi:hypothetical protein